MEEDAKDPLVAVIHALKATFAAHRPSPDAEFSFVLHRRVGGVTQIAMGGSHDDRALARGVFMGAIAESLQYECDRALTDDEVLSLAHRDYGRAFGDDADTAPVQEPPTANPKPTT